MTMAQCLHNIHDIFRWIDVHNPATNQVVTKVPHSTRDEMEAAVESAKNAFQSWSKTTPLARQQIMFR